jgi:hypothetical protein
MEDLFNLACYHMKGEKADELRKGIGLVHPSIVNPSHEKELLEYLVAWAECGKIPMFTSHNRKAFEGCTYRPDVVWDLIDITVMLECDHEAHRNYDRELEFTRMQELLEAASRHGLSSVHTSHTTPDVVFIRFNPSLPGTTSKFKHTKLLFLLADVFAKSKEYVQGGKTVIHLFYPEAPHVWYAQCL